MYYCWENKLLKQNFNGVVSLIVKSCDRSLIITERVENKKIKPLLSTLPHYYALPIKKEFKERFRNECDIDINAVGFHS